MLLLWAVGLWFDLIDVLLYDVRVNARECSSRAARDQITHRVVKGSSGACCWSFIILKIFIIIASVYYFVHRMEVCFLSRVSRCCY